MDLIERDPAPVPWAEGEKIPWNDPEFSRRMLREHLSQDHDAASRRFPTIDLHVAWLHECVLGERLSCVLDLGCGPGLYTSRLARLGHTCVGIDFGPASIEYARETAANEGLACRYELADVRTADFGSGYEMAMMIYGEFNVFRVEDAEAILRKARRALVPGGALVLEPHTFAAVEQTGREAASWYSARSGLFSDSPHLCLMESVWDAEDAIATHRYYVVDAQTAATERYADSVRAYTDVQYQSLLHACGFAEVTFYPGLCGEVLRGQEALLAIVARREE